MNTAHTFQRLSRPGAGTFLTRGALGTSVEASPTSRTRHPWLTTPSWSQALGSWTATVDPGFVNAACPVYTATSAQQQAAGNPAETNPLTGQPFFSDPIFGQPQDTTGPSTSVDLPLYLTPNIPLTFRNVGFDGSGAVPEFFLNLGAASTPQQPSSTDIANGASLNTPPPPPGLRLLRACDLWLQQPRLALTSSVTVNPSGIVTGTSLVTQTLGVATPAQAAKLEIVSGTFVPDTQSINPLNADYEEPTFDQILVSTVWLLSAPNVLPGTVPDGTWTPYPDHNIEWNLGWAQPAFAFQPPAADIGLEGLSFLGLGTAAPIISGTAASLNDATNAALNIINGNSLAGTFWTCTGGGHDATVTLASTTPIAPAQGLNIYQNLVTELAAQRAAQLLTTLDPPFPYTALAAPIALFIP